MIVCPLCKYQSTKKQDLVAHIRDIHVKGLQEFICQFCDFRTTSGTAYERHNSYEHSTDRILSCKDCNYQTTDIIVFDLHRKRHTDETAFACPFCSFSAKVEATFTDHIHTHVLGLYACKDCGFKTRYEFAFILHNQQEHLKAVPFSCEFPNCDFETFAETKLQQHQYDHLDDKTKYKCGVCTYQTTDELSFKAHVSKHTKVGHEKKCPFCRYKSFNPSNFSRHLKNHTGEGLRCCTFCQFKTTRRYVLMRHVARWHDRLNKKGDAKSSVDLIKQKNKFSRQLQNVAEHNKKMNSAIEKNRKTKKLSYIIN